jgi:two-component system phosphate regulon sensor histidine kinase PhoR
LVGLVVGLIYSQVSGLSLPIYLLFIGLPLAALVGLGAAFRVLIPFNRLFLRILKLAEKGRSWNQDDRLEDADDPSFEYLEEALRKIKKKLKKRRAELTHERHEIETLMRVLDSAVVSVRPDGFISYFNSRFATLFMTPEDEGLIKGDSPIALNRFIREPSFLDAMEEAFKQGLQKRLNTELTIGSELCSFSVVMTPLRDEKSKEVYGLLVVLSDRSEIEAARSLRSEFVENASHELRTPLTSIKGFLDAAKADFEQQDYTNVGSFLQIASKSVDKLTELVNDLLTLSKLERKPQISLELMDPQSITQEVFEKLALLASQKKIVMRMTIQSGPFMADPTLVERLLTNLVSNAIKYIQEEGLIQVRWHEDLERKKVLLEVEDNGPGIAEEHLERLFERFYRIEKSRNRDAGGTGLGLAIVKHIMQLHQGEVRVESRTGQGTRFLCEFPYQ